MIDKVIIFGPYLYHKDSYINFGFYNGFIEKDYDTYWIYKDNLDLLNKIDISKNTLFIINTKERNNLIPLNKKLNYYVIIKGDINYFKFICKNKITITEYNTSLKLDDYEKKQDYIYISKTKNKNIIMPYGTIYTPSQIIDNLYNFIELKDRLKRIIYTENYNSETLKKLNNMKSKILYKKKLITLEDEIEEVTKSLYSCCITNEPNKINYRLLTNLSLGTNCITNSEITNQLFNNKLLFYKDSEKFDDEIILKNIYKKEDIFEIIENIINNHTFINRINIILNYFKL